MRDEDQLKMYNYFVLAVIAAGIIVFLMLIYLIYEI